MIDIIREPITRAQLAEKAKALFGDMIKVVVDIDQEVMAIGGELHADEEQLLLEAGSSQQALWGINLYPAVEGEDWLEFDSMINLRPNQGNRTRGVDNPEICQKIIDVVAKLVR